MDPAILSFRQYSSFPHQAQMPHHPQQDIFLQHLAQNQQQNGQGKIRMRNYFLAFIIIICCIGVFSNQSQQVIPGMSMTSNIINGQSTSQTQVNANVQGMLEFLKNRQFV